MIVMFYQEEIDKDLRFGDILTGFVFAAPNLTDAVQTKNFSIEIEQPDYCVVLSPCCSIGDNVITLSPLLKIRPKFFLNPFFVEDMTRINRIMSSEQALGPEAWENMPDEERERRLEEEESFALKDFFVFDQHTLLKKYTLNFKNKDNIETNYYMIDFKNQYKLNCKRMQSATNAPIETKTLQLTVETRSELREKISHYYSRVPVEDQITD